MGGRGTIKSCPWNAPGTLALLLGEDNIWGSVSSESPPLEPSALCPQALAFPDQLYDAVFDGAQVTSKTPIRLYGGALLSEYCWGGLQVGGGGQLGD